MPDVTPDLKTPPRLRDAPSMIVYHRRVPYCEITHADCLRDQRSIHHILPRGRGGDDVFGNFIVLCGSGTTGLHGRVTENDPAALRLLYDHIVANRPDTRVYLEGKLGTEQVDGWLRRVYGGDGS